MSKPLRVLTITERLIPSNIIGIIKPMLSMQRQGTIQFRMKFSFCYHERDIVWADTVVLCRSMEPNMLRIIELIRKHNKQLVYDIDDNFFALPIDTAIGRYHRFPVFLYVVKEMMCNADQLRVYSRPMLEIAQQWTKNARLVRSYFDFSIIGEVEKESHKEIRIVYATSRGNSDTLAQICIPAVRRILEEYGDTVAFYTFGQMPPQLKTFKNAHALKYISNYTAFIREFDRKSFDIGLAPVHDDVFHNSKTNNKFREYGAMSVCGIYSDSQLYGECVNDHQTGLLIANTSEAWYSAMKELIESPELRDQIRLATKNEVERLYSMENTLSDWQDILLAPKRMDRPYKSLLHLKAVILFDRDNNYSSPRMNTLLTVMGICGISHLCSDFYESNLDKLGDYDVVICFPMHNSSVKSWISQLFDASVHQIVIDTVVPFCDVNAYPDVIFTNPAMSATNTYAIKEPPMPRRNINDILGDSSLLDMDMDVERCFLQGLDNIRRSEEIRYSLYGAEGLWAELLGKISQNSGAESDDTRFFAIRKVLKKVQGNLSFVLRPLRLLQHKGLTLFLKAKERLGRLWGCVRDYIKVNLIKRY